MASSEGIAAADLVEKVPSSRQVRYEGRLMNIEAVQRAEKEMDEAETAVEQEHQLAMKGVAEEEAALRLRLQTILARKEALAQREADLKARLQAEKLRVAENTAASASSVHDSADLDDVELLEKHWTCRREGKSAQRRLVHQLSDRQLFRLKYSFSRGWSSSCRKGH